MTAMLLSKGFVENFGAGLSSAAAAAGIDAAPVHLPEDAQTRLSEADCARIEIAYLTRDIRFSELYHSFGATVSAAPNLKWVHFVSTGIDQHPFLAALIERGVRLTTSAGSNGEHGWMTTEMPEAQKRGSLSAPGMRARNSSVNSPPTPTPRIIRPLDR